MKVLHCADIHLDSPMGTLLTSENARKRKLELIQAFKTMAVYADKEDVSAVIIAGDLFDTNKIAVGAKKAVLDTINTYSDIDWYYLKGNHDKNDFLSSADEVPPNLYTFGDEWKTYELSDKVTLTGLEVSGVNSGRMYTDLILKPDRFNIVTLHGQESMAGVKDKAEILNLQALKNQNIDYLALGHVHAFRYEVLDGRGFYCYPGCLEARGFDETSEHGFVILDIDEENRSFTYDFISQPIRSAYRKEVDITGLTNSSDITYKIRAELQKEGYSCKDMVRVNLTGKVDYDCDKNTDYIAEQFAGCYFAFRLKDETKFRIDYEAFRNDKSLKGNFIRTVESHKELSEDERTRIIRYGIQALMGEEIQ